MQPSVVAPTRQPPLSASTDLVHELFEAQADVRPKHPALVCGAEQLTYGELERSANRLARLLRSRGVCRGSLVGLLLPRGIDVHVAILAVLKTGAAYVPLDPDYPVDRSAFILNDCGAHTLITCSALAPRDADFPGGVLLLDDRAEVLAGQSAERLGADETGVRGGDLCYLIYTSGSTGRPKGVQIEHRGVCNFVRAEGEVFRLRPHDRVYQGFSLAFDASVEEVWLAYHAGATLIVGTREMVQAGPALARLLSDARVTVLSCVPTLLAMLDEDIPTLHLLIFGGETCPADLVRRWSRPGRRLVNTYGPTEATVAVTWTDLHPDRPITIGRPFAGCFTYILDEKMQPVAPGVAGELHLGGIGLARGYVGRGDLTREKFVPNPFHEHGAGPERLYKTGDRVRSTPDGDIEFLGRLDAQVKIRGYRVELSEIEAVLLQCPGVQAAAVALKQTGAHQQLVGYVVPRDGSALDEDAIRAGLRERLPTYMVPALLEALPALPMMPSGKVDRARLPDPRARADAKKGDGPEPRTDTERALLRVWSEQLAPLAVGLRDDFFLDLGGHSLLAARMVSELRQLPVFGHLSMLDVYQHPTLEALAAHLDGHRPAAEAQVAVARHRPSSLAHFLCGLAQLGGLYWILAFYSLQWLAPYLTYTWLHDDDWDVVPALVFSCISLLALYPVMLLLTVAVKWVVLGRIQPGRYPLWGFYYFRWWLVNSLLGAVPTGYLCGTPLLALYYRLLGARIGPNVYLGTDMAFAFDLVTIGADTSIGSETNLQGYTVEDGWLIVGPTSIGRGCFIGTRCVLEPGACMEDGASLEDLSLLRRGCRVPASAGWGGAPARPNEGKVRTTQKSGTRPALARRAAFGLLHALGILVFPVLVLLAIFPGMMVMNYLNYEDDYYWYLFAAPAVALSFVVLLCLEITALKWLILGRVKPGRYPLHSSFYLRKWFVDQLLELSIDVLGPLYATIYLNPWYRSLGAKVGRMAEISTASFISPDLLEIGDEGFLADAVSLGAGRVEGGFVTVAANRIGKKSFIGNSALMQPGAIVGDNCLIGCCTLAPAEDGRGVPDDTSWLGSPAFFLPQRQQSAAFPEEAISRPTLKLWIIRGAIEFCRVTLPSTGFIVLTSLLFSAVLLLDDYLEQDELLAIFPILYGACGAVAALFTIVLKWALMGRYRAGERPLWNHFVWRTELATSMRENFADLFLLNMLTGTPFLCWFFRLCGAKIGRRVYLETTEFLEYDLVTVGDDVALNADCTVQTHLFEDRVMKMSHIHIGEGCTVGTMAFVLYDTVMEPGSKLEGLSLLMKGETLPAGTRWAGIPATRQGTG